METLGLGLILSFQDNASHHIHGIIGLLNQFRIALKDVGNVASGITLRGLNTITNATGLLGVAIYGLGVLATGVFKDMVVEITKVGMEMEGMLTALDQMLGSKPKAMSRLLDFEQVAARTPLTFKDVANMGTQLTIVGLDPMKKYEGSWKSKRKRADGRQEGTYSRTLLEALGDLVAMRPDKGVSTAIREGKEFVEGNARPLKMSYGLSTKEILGEKIAAGVEERADQLVRMLAAANIIGGMEKAGENLRTILTNLKSDVELFISYMTLPEEAGAGGFIDYIKEPFKELFEYMKNFTKQRNLMSTVGKSWAEGLKIVVAPAKEIISILSSLIKLALEFSLNHPKIVTFGIAFAGLASQILLFGGALLITAALFLKFKTWLFGSAGMIKFFRNMIVNAGSGLLLFARRIFPVITALSFLYYAFKTNLFGINSLMDSTLNRASNFIDVLFEAMSRASVNEVTGKARFKISREHFNIAEEMGWLDTIQDIVTVEMYVVKFWEGFKRGAEETQDAINEVTNSMLRLLSKFGLIDKTSVESQIRGLTSDKINQHKGTVMEVQNDEGVPILRRVSELRDVAKEKGFGGVKEYLGNLKTEKEYNTASKALGITTESSGLSREQIITQYNERQNKTIGTDENPVKAGGFITKELNFKSAENLGDSFAKLLIPLTFLIGGAHALRFAFNALKFVFNPLITGVRGLGNIFNWFFREQLASGLTRFQTFKNVLLNLGKSLISMALSPMGLALLAIGLAVMLVINHWEQFQNTATEVWNHITQTLVEAWDSITEIMQPAIEALGELWGEFAKAFPEAAQWILGALSKINEKFTASENTAQTVFNVIGTVVKIAFDIIIAAVTISVSLFSGAIQIVVGVIQMLGGIFKIFTEDWEGGWALMHSGAEKFGNGIKTIINGIANAILDLKDRFLAAVDAISEGEAHVRITARHMEDRTNDKIAELKSGGGSAMQTAAIQGRYMGGYVYRPELTWIGERGAEVVLPLNNRQRSIDLFWSAFEDMSKFDSGINSAYQQVGKKGSVTRPVFVPTKTFNISNISNGSSFITQQGETLNNEITKNVGENLNTSKEINNTNITNTFNTSSQKENSSVVEPKTYVYSSKKEGLNIIIPLFERMADGIEKLLTKEEAIKRYEETGKHFGKFFNITTANEIASDLQNRMESIMNVKTSNITTSNSNTGIYSKNIVEDKNKGKLMPNELRSNHIQILGGNVGKREEGNVMAIIKHTGVPEIDNANQQTQEMKKTPIYRKYESPKTFEIPKTTEKKKEETYVSEPFKNEKVEKENKTPSFFEKINTGWVKFRDNAVNTFNNIFNINKKEKVSEQVLNNSTSSIIKSPKTFEEYGTESNGVPFEQNKDNIVTSNNVVNKITPIPTIKSFNGIVTTSPAPTSNAFQQKGADNKNDYSKTSNNDNSTVINIQSVNLTASSDFDMKKFKKELEKYRVNNRKSFI